MIRIRHYTVNHLTRERISQKLVPESLYAERHYALKEGSMIRYISNMNLARQRICYVNFLFHDIIVPSSEYTGHKARLALRKQTCRNMKNMIQIQSLCGHEFLR